MKQRKSLTPGLQLLRTAKTTVFLVDDGRRLSDMELDPKYCGIDGKEKSSQ